MDCYSSYSAPRLSSESAPSSMFSCFIPCSFSSYFLVPHFFETRVAHTHTHTHTQNTHTHTRTMEKLSSHVMLEETFWCGAISLYSVSLLFRLFSFLCNTWQTQLKLPLHTHNFLFFFQKEMDATSCRILCLILLWVESKITKYIAALSVIQFLQLRRIK